MMKLFFNLGFGKRSLIKIDYWRFSYNIDKNQQILTELHPSKTLLQSIRYKKVIQPLEYPHITNISLLLNKFILWKK
jgi:hypothetical protein